MNGDTEMLPVIYSLVGCPAIGELGDATQVRHFPVCPACQRRRAPDFVFIDYRFDRWAGEDLVTAMDCYAVSDRLRQALQNANILGPAFEGMATSQGPDFEIIEPGYADTLPTFHRLIVTASVEGLELWWQSWVCEVCGIRQWERTTEGRHAEIAHLTNEVGTPREVYKDSWHGDDIFRFEDPGPFVVTQNFADVLNRIGVTEIVLHPAKWVDRS